MFVEFYALKCFTLGSIFTGITVWKWAKYKMGCKTYMIESTLGMKKP